MRLTPDQVEFVENMAREQRRYQTIINEQSEVLRTDPPESEAATARVQQSPLVAKRGQRWEPTQDKVDEYLAQCNDLCNLVPQDFDDRVKIVHGAYAALACIIICKIGRQPSNVRLAISERRHLLSLSANPTSQKINNNSQSPLTKRAVEPRGITPEELRFFQNPDNLHGKQFIISPDTDDSGMYEVIGYRRARDKALTFDVLFEDCDDAVAVGEKEMIDMLRDSLYLPV